MTILDQSQRLRALSRYRMLFRAMVATFAVSVVVAAIGLVGFFNGASATLFGAALLVAAMSGLNGYKMVLSTMKLIDEDGGDPAWRQFSS